MVIEPTFEAAAIAYLEHLAVSAGTPAEISLIVHDVGSGDEHSFLVHLDGGEMEARDERTGPNYDR